MSSVMLLLTSLAKDTRFSLRSNLEKMLRFMLVADVVWKPNAHSFALADDHYHTYAMYNFGQQMHRLLLLTENPWERSSKYVKPSEVHTKGNGSCNLCGKVSIASNSWHSSSCASYNTSISAFLAWSKPNENGTCRTCPFYKLQA